MLDSKHNLHIFIQQYRFMIMEQLYVICATDVCLNSVTAPLISDTVTSFAATHLEVVLEWTGTLTLCGGAECRTSM